MTFCKMTLCRKTFCRIAFCKMTFSRTVNEQLHSIILSVIFLNVLAPMKQTLHSFTLDKNNFQTAEHFCQVSDFKINYNLLCLIQHEHFHLTLTLWYVLIPVASCQLPVASCPPLMHYESSVLPLCYRGQNPTSSERTCSIS